MITPNVARITKRLKSRGWKVLPSGCWDVNGASTGAGYVQIHIDGSYISAHRAAHMAWVGPIPKNLLVRHSCDNPRCINPKHLLLGTQQQNMDDKVQRGRVAHAEKHGMAKLTSEQVREIVFARRDGASTYRLAAQYNVSRKSISNILKGRTWQRVVGDIL